MILALLVSVLAVVPANFSDQLVAAGFTAPIALDFLPDGRCLVAERAGTVRLVDPDSVSIQTLFSIPGVDAIDEDGLLGLAADPTWPIDIDCLWTTTDGRLRVARFSPLGEQEQVLLDMPNLQRTHNGGTLRWGPDHRLYASVGDDHLTCSPPDTAALTGKILRLGTCYTDPDPPRWVAKGLRNPFRFSIDPATGEFLIGDVGEASWEEVDRGPAGLDFGWPSFEGPADLGGGTGCAVGTGLTAPAFAYPHSQGLAVVGGLVYRRPHVPGEWPLAYDGSWFASDFYVGTLWRDGSPWGSGFAGVTDWVEAPDGSVWYAAMNAGQVRRIAYVGVAGVAPAAQGSRPAALYDLQGRRVEHPGPGLYFTRQGRRVVVLR